MTQNYKQNGFAHLGLIMAALVIGVIAFTAGAVYNAAQQRKQANQANTSDTVATIKQLQAKNAENEDAKTVDLPAEEKPKTVAQDPVTTEKKPEPTTTEKKKPDTSQVSIKSTSSSVKADSVVMTAQLPSTYSGTCKVLVKHMDGSNAQWHEASFGPSSTCSITVAKNKLTSASKWQYYMYFYNSDYSVKGSSGSNTFNL